MSKTVDEWDELKDSMPTDHSRAAELMFDLLDKMADEVERLELARVGVSKEGAFLERLGERGGAIVSSGACSTMEIADARARGDMFVTEEGYGFVLRLPEWLAKVQP